MLFDLRSRGRRTTVRAVYLGLAILIGGGLILFGVGTGIGGGGLLNAFNGGGSNGQQVVSGAERQAEKAVKADPNNAAAWGQLVRARQIAANQGCDTTVSPPRCTQAGKNDLVRMADAWEKYVSLTNRPDPTLALSMARAYALLGQYGKAASTWETVAGSQPSAHAFECLAVSSYAAGDSRKAQLAAAKALSLLPKVQQPRLKQLFTAAKTSPKTARGFAASC